MTYVILDDKFHSNGKILDVGNTGAGVYARCLSYCGDQLTDGFVRLSWVKQFANKKTLDALTTARLWRAVEPGDTFTVQGKDGDVTVTIEAKGFYIDDYLTLNPSRSTVSTAREEVRRKRSEAGKKGAASRWHSDSNGDGKDIADGWQTHGPQPQPQPQEVVGSPAKQTSREIAEKSDPVERLLAVLPDATQHTGRTIRKLVLEHRLSEGDLAWAQECATGPGVTSPVRVAVGELKKRAAQKKGAA